MAVKQAARAASAPSEESLELEMLRTRARRLRRRGAAPRTRSATTPRRARSAGTTCVYWTGGNYIGLGPSAASHVRGLAVARTARTWASGSASIAGGRLPAVDVETLTPRQRAGELAMLLLRLSRGLNFADFAARTGV